MADTNRAIYCRYLEPWVDMAETWMRIFEID